MARERMKKTFIYRPCESAAYLRAGTIRLQSFSEKARRSPKEEYIGMTSKGRLSVHQKTGEPEPPALLVLAKPFQAFKPSFQNILGDSAFIKVAVRRKSLRAA